MTLDLQLPKHNILKPQITVFGVGGAGGNATNNMIQQNLEGATFVVANTDAQALEQSSADKRIQLGQNTTQGLGAGASPEVGAAAAEEALDEIQEHLQGANMVFITAGMGGGTGTGAAPVIARAAREKGILTVGVVTKPFHFEGPKRMRLAEEGVKELQRYVDTLIIIPNQNLFRVANEKTTFADAFAMADDVLHAGVRGVTDLMVMPGLINLDFADVKAVMSEMGKAMMGTGQAEGEQRAQEAAEAAISNPLLDNVSMKGARGVLINITGGSDLTLFEVDEAANRIRQEVDADANIIFGSTFNEELDGKIRVSVVATGIDVDESLKEKEVAPAVPAAAPEQVANDDQSSPEASQELQTAMSGQGDEALEEVMAGLNAEYEAQKDQEEPSVVSEGFVPKAPVTPESYHDEVLAAATSQVASDGVESEPAVRRPFSKQIFSKVAEMARSFQGKDSAVLHTPTQNPTPTHAPAQPQSQPVQQDLNVSTENLSVDAEEEGATQEDMMDIPAFLRRKKSVNE